MAPTLFEKSVLVLCTVFEKSAASEPFTDSAAEMAGSLCRDAAVGFRAATFMSISFRPAEVGRVMAFVGDGGALVVVWVSV